MPTIDGLETISKINAFDALVDLAEREGVIRSESEQGLSDDGREVVIGTCHVPGQDLTQEAIDRIRQEVSVGNARENTICNARLAALLPGDTVSLDDLGRELAQRCGLGDNQDLAKDVIRTLLETPAVTSRLEERENGDLCLSKLDQIDRDLGGGLTKAKILSAAVAALSLFAAAKITTKAQLEQIVERTSVDLGNLKDMSRVALRTLANMRADVLQFGWGDCHRKIAAFMQTVRRQELSEETRNSLNVAFLQVQQRANAIRSSRAGLVAGLTLDGLGDLRNSPATLLAAIGRKVVDFRTVTEESVRSLRNNDARKLAEYHEAVTEFLDVLAGIRQDADVASLRLDALEALAAEESGTTCGSVAQGLAVAKATLGRFAAYGVRAGEHERLREQLHKAFGQLPKENGHYKSGLYQAEIDVLAGGAVGPQEAEAIFGVKYRLIVKLEVSANGACTMSYDNAAGFGGKGKLFGDVASVDGYLLGGHVRSTTYASVDDFFESGATFMATALTGRVTSMGRESAVKANASEMRKLARSIDNYAFRKYLERSCLLTATDRFLAPRMSRNMSVKASSWYGEVGGSGSAEFESVPQVNLSAKASASYRYTHENRQKVDFGIFETNVERMRTSLADQEHQMSAEDAAMEIRKLVDRVDRFSDTVRRYQHGADRGFTAGEKARRRTDLESFYEGHDVAVRGLRGAWRSLNGTLERSRATRYLAILARQAETFVARLRLAQDRGEAVDADVELLIARLRSSIYERPAFRISESIAREELYTTKSVAVTQHRLSVSIAGGLSVKALEDIRKRDTTLGNALASLEIPDSIGGTLVFTDTKAGDPDRLPPWKAQKKLLLSIDFGGTAAVDDVITLVGRIMRLWAGSKSGGSIVKDLTGTVADIAASYGVDQAAKRLEATDIKHKNGANKFTLGVASVGRSSKSMRRIVFNLTADTARGNHYHLDNVEFRRTLTEKVDVGVSAGGFGGEFGVSRLRETTDKEVLSLHSLGTLMGKFESLGSDRVKWMSFVRTHMEFCDEALSLFRTVAAGGQTDAFNPQVLAELTTARQKAAGDTTGLREALARAEGQIGALADDATPAKKAAALQNMLKVLSDLYAGA